MCYLNPIWIGTLLGSFGRNCDIMTGINCSLSSFIRLWPGWGTSVYFLFSAFWLRAQATPKTLLILVLREGGTLMKYIMYQSWNHKWIQPVNACVWFVHARNRYKLILRNRHHRVQCTLLHKKSSSTCFEYLHSSVSNRTGCWLGDICLFMLEMCSTAFLSSVFLATLVALHFTLVSK